MPDETMEERLFRLEYWRNGNGARGAEKRLQSLEEHTLRAERVIELVQKVCREGEYVTQEQIQGIIVDASTAAVKKIIDNAKGRDKTTVAKIKAWAPYFAGLVALIVALYGKVGP